MISEVIPHGNSELDVVACYLKYGDTFLLLKRNSNKKHGNTWGLAAGKVEAGETLLEAVIREVKEETGCDISSLETKSLPSLLVENNDINFNYHYFMVTLHSVPTILLSEKEHQEYKWVTLKESFEMELIHDLASCNRLFFNFLVS